MIKKNKKIIVLFISIIVTFLIREKINCIVWLVPCLMGTYSLFLQLLKIINTKNASGLSFEGYFINTVKQYWYLVAFLSDTKKIIPIVSLVIASILCTIIVFLIFIYNKEEKKLSNTYDPVV